MIEKVLFITGSDGFLGRALIEEASNRNIHYIGLSKRSSQPNIALYSNGKICMNEISSFNRELLTAAEIEKVVINTAWSGDTQITAGSLSKQLENLIFIEELLFFIETYSFKNLFNVGSMDEVVVERQLSGCELVLKDFSHLNYGLAKLAVRDVLKFMCYKNKINFTHAKVSIMVDPKLGRKNFVENNLRRILDGNEFISASNQELCNISTYQYVAKQILDNLSISGSSDIVLGSSLALTLNEYFLAFSAMVESKSIMVNSKVTGLLSKNDFGQCGLNDKLSEQIFMSLFQEVSNG